MIYVHPIPEGNVADRLHIVVEAADKERFREIAGREGKTLSEWVRDAAREKAAASDEGRQLGSTDALEAFFAECDARETGREPDWESHRAVIERSVSQGSAP
jgi:hypothetical protein